MRRMLREVRRAPARIITAVAALALAVAAIGVFAIPEVSSASLRTAAREDGLPHIVVHITDSGAVDVVSLVEAVPGVDRAELQAETVVTPVATSDELLQVVGYDLESQEMDVLRVAEGRKPAARGEIVVTEDVAAVGTSIEVNPTRGPPVELEVVGIGNTSYWAGETVAFATADTVAGLEGLSGSNRLVVRAVDSSEDALRTVTDAIRVALAGEGISVVEFPLIVPGGTHPIEEDISMISMLIGMLGVVAGVVALVLLGSTTNTLITERSQEVAVMRALGARRRPLRRRLRRLAVGIAAAAAVIGIPLGILIANVIARLVLGEFLDMTPGFAVSWTVVVGSFLFAVVGARVVAARAARRVTTTDLATALRDRDGSPNGGRVSERLAAKVGVGGLLERAALRNGVHQRARSLATVAQIAAAVAALMTVTSLTTSVNDFNAAEVEPWRYASITWAAGNGLPIDATVVEGVDGAEATIEAWGEVNAWDLDVLGMSPDTRMIDRTVDEGTWLAGGDDTVVTTGFAAHNDIEVGDTIDVGLASGSHEFQVVGLHPYQGRAIFVDSSELAADLGTPGMVNQVMSFERQSSVDVGVASVTRQLAGDAEEQAARDMIVKIFGAIGLIIVSVAGLAVASGLAVGLHERRDEFAALQALGGRRRHVFRMVTAELLPLACVGIVLGLGAGYVGARWIMDSFASANAIELGFTYASGAIPLAIAVVVLGSLVLGGLMVRRATHRSVAVTLRGAS